MPKSEHAEKWRFFLDEFDDIQTAQRDVRTQALEDRRFALKPGAQWEGPLGEAFDQKPKFELNKVHLSLIRIFSEYRNNRLTVDFRTKDGREDSTADACDGLYRADEQLSVSEEAYDTAFDESVAGGMGAWRLRARYDDEDDDDNDAQRIEIAPIHDADTCVFFDLGAKRQDKSDAKRCYVLHGMRIDAYRDEYGDDPTTWPHDIKFDFTWATKDEVHVAEIYELTERRELVHYFRGLDDEDMAVTAEDLEANPEKRRQYEAMGFSEVRQKRVRRRTVTKWTASGSGILRDPEVIAGSQIPVIPVYGKRWVLEGVENFMGHVRLAKDAQRLVNMLASWLADMAWKSDNPKPILTPEQIVGHAQMWADDAVKRYPYLVVNGLPDPTTGALMPTPPVGWTQQAQIPQPMAALVQIAEQGLSDLTGGQQAAEQVVANTSGKLMEMVQQRLDMQVYIYMANMRRAMTRCGQVWLSMARDLLREENRRMKTVGADGSVGSVVINQPGISKETSEKITLNNIADASLDVVVDVGPSSSTRRTATVRELTALRQITQDPETASVLDALILMNTEGEGLGEVNEYFRAKLVRQGVLKPTDEEAKQMLDEQKNAQPDPQSQALLGMARQAEADAAAAKAKTLETLASADLKKAQTEKTLIEAHSGAVAGNVSNMATIAGMSKDKDAKPDSK